MKRAFIFETALKFVRPPLMFAVEIHNLAKNCTK